MQPVLWSAINTIVSSRAFPYRDASEFIRHAIVRHVRWTESIGDVPSVSGQVEAANVVLQEDQMYEEYQETFTSLRGRITDYISRGDHQEARRLITQMQGYFKRMPESYWRTQYERQLKEWDYLFQNAPTVKLVPFTKE